MVTDASGNIHAKDGKFAGHVRGEANDVASLAQVVSGEYENTRLCDMVGDMSEPDDDLEVSDLSDHFDSEAFGQAQVCYDKVSEAGQVELVSDLPNLAVSDEFYDDNEHFVNTMASSRWPNTSCDTPEGGMMQMMFRTDVDGDATIKEAVDAASRNGADEYRRAVDGNGDIESFDDGIRSRVRAWGANPDADSVPNQLTPQWGTPAFAQSIDELRARRNTPRPEPEVPMLPHKVDVDDVTSTEAQATTNNGLTLEHKFADGMEVYETDDGQYVCINWSKDRPGADEHDIAQRINGDLRRGLWTKSYERGAAVTAMTKTVTEHIPAYGEVPNPTGKSLVNPDGTHSYPEAAVVVRTVNEYGEERDDLAVPRNYHGIDRFPSKIKD